jgi:hypothetical protein
MKISIDVLRKIFREYLDHPTCVAARLVCRTFRNLIEQPQSDKAFSLKAARQGYLSLLKWARANGCPWNALTYTYASANGHPEILQWLKENGVPSN